jgi:hypothetical protein
MTTEETREKLLTQFFLDRPLAHKVLFAHRHKDEDPEFHREMCELLYSDAAEVALMAFRGGAKSTYVEEYALLRALFREDIYTLLVGPKEASASQRLMAIRNELEINDLIIELFGDQKAAPWSTTELKLANGAKIEAMGAGQSMRGKKDNAERPDAALIDDLEDEETIKTKESRQKVERWLTGTLLPALHPTKGRVRFVGTPLHPEALIVKKCADPTWKSRVFPILYLDPATGQETPTWPGRFPLDWCIKKRQSYLNSGNYIEWEQEYMCRAEDVAGKPFQASMIKVEAVPNVHLPVYMFVDPARTVKERSARTGYVAWSWLGNRLIVHKAQGSFHKPDEIVNEILQWDNQFKPVHVGVEAVGLEEFLMQPLRAAASRLGRSVPFVDIRAPKDKDSFIRGLQPFYIAGDVLHAQHLPDLEQELVQFPSGRKDVLNALAYALRMRAGRPVYEDFTFRHIAAILEPRLRLPRYLVVSARPARTAAALVQYLDGAIKIYADWAVDAPPQECFGTILREAILIGGQVKVAAPAEQFDQYTNHGLPAAIRREQITPVRLGNAARCEGQFRDWLRKQVQGEMALLVHNEARWVKNAFAGGYARKLDKHGHLAEQTTDDQYRLVMEALESWAFWLDKEHTLEGTDGLRYAETADGRKYITLRPNS